MIPPAGWHVDPHNDASWRYWDGAQWTEHTSPRFPPPAAAGAGPANRGVKVAGIIAVCAIPVLLSVFLFAVTASRRDVPEEQAAFMHVVAQHRAQGLSGDSEIKVKRALEQRGRALCDVMGDRAFSAWRGKVSDINSSGDKAGLMIDVGDDVEIGTWNNGFSDIGDKTLIAKSSSLYDAVAGLDVGDVVEVSGTFIADSDSCVRETSITDIGSLDTPDFLARFNNVDVVN